MTAPCWCSVSKLRACAPADTVLGTRRPPALASDAKPPRCAERRVDHVGSEVCLRRDEPINTISHPSTLQRRGDKRINPT